MPRVSEQLPFPTNTQLNRLTNAQLFQLAQSNRSDTNRLLAIQDVLRPRKRYSAVRAQRFVGAQLEKLKPTTPITMPDLTHPVQPPKRSMGIWKYVLAALGIVVAGIGQAAGSQFWNTLWPIIRGISLGSH